MIRLRVIIGALVGLERFAAAVGSLKTLPPPPRSREARLRANEAEGQTHHITAATWGLKDAAA